MIAEVWRRTGLPVSALRLDEEKNSQGAHLTAARLF